MTPTIRFWLCVVVLLLGGTGCPKNGSETGRASASPPTEAEIIDDRGELLAIRGGVMCDGKIDDSDALYRRVASPH